MFRQLKYLNKALSSLEGKKTKQQILQFYGRYPETGNHLGMGKKGIF